MFPHKSKTPRAFNFPSLREEGESSQQPTGRQAKLREHLNFHTVVFYPCNFARSLGAMAGKDTDSGNAPRELLLSPGLGGGG